MNMLFQLTIILPFGLYDIDIFTGMANRLVQRSDAAERLFNRHQRLCWRLINERATERRRIKPSPC